MKLFAIYEKPFWRDAGLNGQVLSDLPTAPYVSDNSPPTGGPGILLTFVNLAGMGSGPGLHWTDAILDEPAARRASFVKDLTTLFGPKAATPIGYLEQDWTQNPWINGCISTAPPGVRTEYTTALRDPFGRVTGPRPRPPSSTPATWTEPSAPANEPHKRSPVASDHQARHIVCLGAASETCHVAIDRFAAANPGWHYTLADADPRLIAPLAERLPRGTATIRRVDLCDREQLGQLIQGASLVVNAARPFTRTALPVIETCLLAGASYIDVNDNVESTQACITSTSVRVARGSPAGLGAAPRRA